jgi:hypothetical protein
MNALMSAVVPVSVQPVGADDPPGAVPPLVVVATST